MAAYRAVVIGATGAVGGALVRDLLASTRCGAVTALVRRSVDTFDALPGREKLRLEQIDFGDLEGVTRRLTGPDDPVFCTMGVGQPRKAAFEDVWRVDVEYAGAFARGAAAAGARHVSLLSSVGASKNSRSRYLRMKGAAEQAVIDAGIPRVSLFRPSLLVTAQMRYGLQDRLTQTLFPMLALFLPDRFHQIRVEDLATAMRVNAERPGSAAVEVLHYPDCLALWQQRLEAA
jgi:uncharacterized protein YbjT (DUF2867 family)